MELRYSLSYFVLVKQVKAFACLCLLAFVRLCLLACACPCLLAFACLLVLALACAYQYRSTRYESRCRAWVDFAQCSREEIHSKHERLVISYLYVRLARRTLGCEVPMQHERHRVHCAAMQTSIRKFTLANVRGWGNAVCFASCSFVAKVAVF